MSNEPVAFQSRDLLTLNVRGTKFLVEKGNLLKRHEESLLYMLASKFSCDEVNVEEKGGETRSEPTGWVETKR